MLGHLKAEDFVNLMEGVDPPSRHRAHLDGCAQCRTTWESMQSVHAEISSMESDIPEPDWSQFRASVRDELLSRSVQRQSAMRRWTGWTIRPAVAWALSVVMAVGITTMMVLWQTGRPAQQPAPTPETTRFDLTVEAFEAGPERSLFDDVVALGEEEQERFRKMLESGDTGTVYPQ
jgi:hypothetical protein